jgi:hypothetical protein
MKRVDNVYKSSNYSPEETQASPFGDIQRNAVNTLGNTVGELTEDVSKVGGALVTFPYGSAFKLAGLGVMVYIGFKVLRKFVNMEETVKKLMRGR